MEGLFVALVVLMALGMAAAIIVVLRVGRTTAAAIAPGQQVGLERLRATLHMGAEQTLLGIHREIDLPKGAGEVPYGGMYVAEAADTRLVVRTRSELDRGLMSVIDIRRTRTATVVVYSILRLPGDQDLLDAVLALELRLIKAVRRLDRSVDVRLSGTALREFGRSRINPPSDLMA
jgi:hypothetical protein